MAISAPSVIGLFSGIGGMETGLTKGLGENSRVELLADNSIHAQLVLKEAFPGVPVATDVKLIKSIPSGADVLAAGLPAADITPTGKTVGISGVQSGVVEQLFRIVRTQAPDDRPHWVVLETVPNILRLNKGAGMRYLTGQLEELGFTWAYRTLDARFTGLPHRRRRIVLLASRTEDPRILLVPDVGSGGDFSSRTDSFGFYWTEGKRGLGLVQDAVPALKAGSGVGIASPPAIWIRNPADPFKFVLPSPMDGELLQGFTRGRTQPPGPTLSDGERWKLIGEASPVPMYTWLGSLMVAPPESAVPLAAFDPDGPTWPPAAWGHRGAVYPTESSEVPERLPYRHLLEVIALNEQKPLSKRAATGLALRLSKNSLGRAAGFREDLTEYTGVPLTSNMLFDL